MGRRFYLSARNEEMMRDGTRSTGGRHRTYTASLSSTAISDGQPAWEAGIGAVGGGIWRSDDSGQSFKNLDDKLASLAISCMTEDSEGFVYAGTGEVFASDGIKWIGILCGLDGKPPGQASFLRERRCEGCFTHRKEQRAMSEAPVW
jgi:hypothetical protein